MAASTGTPRTSACAPTAAVRSSWRAPLRAAAPRFRHWSTWVHCAEQCPPHSLRDWRMRMQQLQWRFLKCIHTRMGNEQRPPARAGFPYANRQPDPGSCSAPSVGSGQYERWVLMQRLSFLTYTSICHGTSRVLPPGERALTGARFCFLFIAIHTRPSARRGMLGSAVDPADTPPDRGLRGTPRVSTAATRPTHRGPTRGRAASARAGFPPCVDGEG